MTAKEKADELLSKCFSYKFEDDEAKYFARLICDEVINYIIDLESLDTEGDKAFWEQVRKEIYANS